RHNLRDKPMSFPISPVLAQAAPAAGAQGGGMSMIIMMVVLFGLMYFMMIRPQMKRQKECRAAGVAQGFAEVRLMSTGLRRVAGGDAPCASTLFDCCYRCGQVAAALTGSRHE